MTDAKTTIPTWHVDAKAEDAMGGGHAPMWRHLINIIPERDLSRKAVLDYGCNQGGFLRTLYATRPFRHGLGVDIATQSIDRAKELAGTLPIQYRPVSDLSAWVDHFDIAFSYEVIYLVPDLASHAAAIAQTLKPGGIYYAVTGCHTGSPLWPHWREFIASKTHASVQDYSLDDIATAFVGAGLSVSARKFAYDGFVPFKPQSGYYPEFSKALDYFTEIKTIFRIIKDG